MTIYVNMTKCFLGIICIFIRYFLNLIFMCCFQNITLFLCLYLMTIIKQMRCMNACCVYHKILHPFALLNWKKVNVFIFIYSTCSCKNLCQLNTSLMSSLVGDRNKEITNKVVRLQKWGSHDHLTLHLIFRLWP